MNNDVLKSKIKNIVRSDHDNLHKKVQIIAIITKALEVKGITPVIVGGQAVEFYTSGGYATMDIDMLCELSISEIDSVLKPLGFFREGKYWIIEEKDFELALEVPSGPLAGSWDKVIKVRTNEGMFAYFIGIEDIIIDRLNRYKFWREFSDEEWVLGMIILNYEEIDWDYTNKRAEQEGTLNELRDFKAKAEEILNKK
ncbi:DUF6036 family nucleotidyltransferase [Tepidibacillus sp. HK-1]|uniref:DUF6036 family nucleotidyltransferase n=1 Tax=Tepidibacillus sp. HK-1 TaxID=1883407 RepID=UPI000853EB15|nr:DUF6036 family nucleotidyltransferase [Tepidibacillus sp. HK-1]GBF11187.1 hypothetical protein HK1_01211 [Tepidibacillus sp. HK-1]